MTNQSMTNHLLETTETWLEMKTPFVFSAAQRDDVFLERQHTPDTDQYINIFRDIGKDWLWQARLLHSREEISQIISSPDTDLYYLRKSGTGRIIGLLELDFSDPANANLAYFGLVSDGIGQGLGKHLIQSAISIVNEHRPHCERFWFTTCTFDHPRALDFYKKQGFSVFKTDVKSRFTDPRLNPNLCGGPYPANCAPHVPLATETASWAGHEKNLRISPS